MKKGVLRRDYYLPGQLEWTITRFEAYCNRMRSHESLDNLTPADVYYRRSTNIPHIRKKIENDNLAPTAALSAQGRLK